VNNDIRNSGVIRLESELAGYQSNLTIVNGLLINTYIINVNVGSGGARMITGQVLNRCRINVNHDLTFNGTFTNRAILDIDATKQMTLNGSAQVFNQNGGYIGGNGLLALSNGATMNFNRGATTGANPPTLSNAKLNFGPAATGAATLIMQGQNSQLSGDIGTEQTVWIRGNGQPGNAIITALGGFTNAGVIRLESQGAAYESDLTIASGVLTNTGRIDVNRGAGGVRTISGTLVNQGALNVNFVLTFNGSFSNHDMLTIASGQTMVLNGNTYVFNQNAGAIVGKGVLTLFNGAILNFNHGATPDTMPTLTNAKLNFGPAATGVAKFIMQGQSSQLSGDIGAEQTVWIKGNGQPGNASITALGGFTNAGVIRLESQVAGYTSNLIIANDDTLANKGTIDVNEGSGGGRVITGQVDNQGSVNVNHDLRINGNFTTNGILSIGLGPGNVNFDQLQVSGSAVLDSTLNLNVASDFNPPLNTTYQIVTCDTCSGIFTTVNGSDLGNGKHLKVIYNPTNVTLQVAPEEAITGLTTTTNSPTPLDSVTTFRATVTAGSNVSYAWNFGDGTMGNGRIVTHTYKAAGNYTTTVTATNSLGSATDTTVANIFIVPIAGLTASNDSPTRVDSVTTLTATVTTGSRVNYIWNFGDGTPIDSGAVVKHTYRAAGNYMAIVTATNAVTTLTDTTIVAVIPTTAVEESEPGIPTSFMLSQNYPNPFNPSTTIRYAIPQAGHVTLKIYNLLGKEIAALVNEKQSAGEHTIRWNPVGLPSGIYLYRLQAGDASAGSAQRFVATKKLVLMK
jgi:PKD repeat protein